MTEIERATALIGPVIRAMGFDVVRVAMIGKSRPTLQVMIEPEGGGGLTVDDCAAVSRALSELLDTEDPIGGAYLLEVSSPGIDRPLTRMKDFDRFAGHEARVDLERPLENGRKRLQGRLAGTEGDLVRLRVGEDEVRVAFGDIRRAKLVLTDELLAAAEKGQG
ncbi:MAG: ribosome maturation factor RimP [Alphaproteobacteria bacterium]